MSQAESIFIVAITVLLIAMIVGNMVFQLIAERRNPPVGRFLKAKESAFTTLIAGGPMRLVATNRFCTVSTTAGI
jgi:nitrogen fixation/metabolism regulation signal transduction histidine kinase